MKKPIEHVLSMALMIALAGCNLPGGAVPESGGATPTALPEPLPSGYIDLLQEKIASGEWTLEVGLITLLRMFVGEIPSGQAGLGEGVLEAEGTSILRLAGGYLQTGTDASARDEIARLINILVPPQEVLDRYSIPAEHTSGRPSGMAAPARQDLQACNQLWAAGFPDERTPSFVCFLVDEAIIGGSTYRVYYPKDWRGDGTRDEFRTATLDATLDAINIYRPYGTIKSIYFVFTTLPDETDRDGFTTLAWTATNFFRPGTEACPVIINPAALTGEVAEYKQTIAHEIFHCFQAWNLGNQINGPGVDSDWWVEGTAEYFSNLVYPSANYEYDFANSFSSLSKIKPLTNMSYENFVFFQFMGNRINPEGVLAMLRRMPTAPGREAQLAALAAEPGIEDTFEEFVRSVMDMTLMDSDGSKMGLPLSATEVFRVSDLASRTFTSHPFVFSRFQIIFDSEKSFSVETLPDGQGRSAWRPNMSVGSWGLLPATATGGCEVLGYLMYITSTTPGVVRRETVTTTMVSEAPCDECLIGRWEATTESVQAYMLSVYTGEEETIPTVESITGIMYLEFLVNGIGYGGYENLMIYETNVGGNASTEAILAFEGGASGPFSADGTSLTGLAGTNDILVTVEILVGGASLGVSNIPFQPEDFPVSPALPTRYTCSDETLLTWPPVAGVTVDPLVFHRVLP